MCVKDFSLIDVFRRTAHGVFPRACDLVSGLALNVRAIDSLAGVSDRRLCFASAAALVRGARGRSVNMKKQKATRNTKSSSTYDSSSVACDDHVV